MRDGVSLRVKHWAGASSERPPVWLHHGFIANADINWNLPGVVDALLAAGRQVYAHDAIGHGQSDRPHDPASYGEPRMAADLWELVDRLGIEQIDLVGYSMGAVVATLAASAQPNRVRRLVIGGVGSGMVEVGGADRRVLDPDQIAAAMLAEDPEDVAGTAGYGFRRFADTAGGDRLAFAAQAGAMYGDGFDFSRLSMPVALVVGTNDALADRPEVLAEAIIECTLVTVEGDHLNAVGTPAFKSAVVDFLK